VPLFLPQGFAGELDMDAELDKMEAGGGGGGGGGGRGGGRQQKQQRKPGERFTAGADNRSKKREQRDSKYGGWEGGVTGGMLECLGKCRKGWHACWEGSSGSGCNASMLQEAPPGLYLLTHA
jgi:hypothetical protein